MNFTNFPGQKVPRTRHYKEQIHIHRKVTEYAKVSYNLDKKLKIPCCQLSAAKSA